MKKQITLTCKEAELILWVAEAGLDQLEKHLRHDDWDEGMSAQDRHVATWADRKFHTAIKLLKKKIAGGAS